MIGFEYQHRLISGGTVLAGIQITGAIGTGFATSSLSNAYTACIANNGTHAAEPFTWTISCR